MQKVERDAAHLRTLANYLDAAVRHEVSVYTPSELMRDECEERLLRRINLARALVERAFELEQSYAPR